MAEQPKKKGKTLSEHAAYELTKAKQLGGDTDPAFDKMITDTLALVRRFEKQNHDEKSARFVLEAFERICSFLPITPITDDPDEWDKFEMERRNIEKPEEVEKKVVWQSRRATSVFSEDEGKTFMDQNTGKTGTSVDYLKQREEVAKARAEYEAAQKARKTPVTPPAKPVGHVDPDVPAAEAPVQPTTDTATEAAQKEKKQ